MKNESCKIFTLFVLTLLVMSPLSIMNSPTRAVEAGPTPEMYWKAGHADYAASGMPDFDQRQWGTYNWTTWGTWSHCGPVAVANSLWWYDSAYENNTIPPPTAIDNFPLVTAYGSWDDHDPQNVQPLVEHLAYLMDTDGNRTGFTRLGTKVTDMETGITQYLSWAGNGTINPQGDVNGDAIVNQTDYNIVLTANGTAPGQADWNMAADIWPVTTGWPNQTKADNKVDNNDLNLVTVNMNKTGMFCEDRVFRPDLHFIEDEVERGEDVVLSLGFYTEREMGILLEGFEGGTFADWDFHYSTNGAQNGSIPAGTWNSSIVSGGSALQGNHSARLFADSNATLEPWRVDAAINRTVNRGIFAKLKTLLKFDQITDPGGPPSLGHAFFEVRVINALNTSEFISYGFDNSSSLDPGDISYDVSPGDLVNFEADMGADYFNKYGKALPSEVMIRFLVSADYDEMSSGRQTIEVRLDSIIIGFLSMLVRDDYPYPYGHFVTVAGINSTTMQIAISDPAVDAFELGLVPGRSPVPHVHTPPEPPYITHNNASLVSYDIYNVSCNPIWGCELAGYPSPELGICHVFIEYAVITSPLVHDVAVIDVLSLYPQIDQGLIDPINVTVENQGNFTETVDVYAFYDGNVAAPKQTVYLDPGENATLIFNWNTTGLPLGQYTVSANATIPIDHDPLDNYLEGNTQEVIPEFPSSTLPLILAILSLVTIILKSKKKKQ